MIGSLVDQSRHRAASMPPRHHKWAGELIGREASFVI
jgi:hypothetical protein